MFYVLDFQGVAPPPPPPWRAAASVWSPSNTDPSSVTDFGPSDSITDSQSPSLVTSQTTTFPTRPPPPSRPPPPPPPGQHRRQCPSLLPQIPFQLEHDIMQKYQSISVLPNKDLKILEPNTPVISNSGSLRSFARVNAWMSTLASHFENKPTETEIVSRPISTFVNTPMPSLIKPMSSPSQPQLDQVAVLKSSMKLSRVSTRHLYSLFVLGL